MTHAVRRLETVWGHALATLLALQHGVGQQDAGQVAGLWQRKGEGAGLWQLPVDVQLPPLRCYLGRPLAAYVDEAVGEGGGNADTAHGEADRL